MIKQYLIVFLLFTAVGCEVEILKKIPEPYTISSGDIVYVENDGRCSFGEVIKITGVVANLMDRPWWK